MTEKDNLYCLCSRCGSTFNYADAKIVMRLLYSNHIEEKKCPFCGSGCFSPEKDIEWLDKLNENKERILENGKI